MSVEELAVSHYKSQGFLNGNYTFKILYFYILYYLFIFIYIFFFYLCRVS